MANELATLNKVVKLLDGMTDDERSRAMMFINDRFGIIEVPRLVKLRDHPVSQPSELEPVPPAEL